MERDTRLKDFVRWPGSVRLMIGVVVVLLFGVYFFYHAYPAATGRSLAGWTWLACNGYNGFLHGRLVPLLFPWMIWWAWKCKREEVVRPSYWGMVWLVLGMVMFWASMRLVQPRWAMFGAPFVVIGLGQYLFGWKVAKAVVFPAFFLWFAIPVPGLESWADNWGRPLMAKSTIELGGWLGMDISPSGEVRNGEDRISISFI
jgi:hypothetical protein